MKILKTNMLMLALLLAGGSFYVAPIMCMEDVSDLGPDDAEVKEDHAGEKAKASSRRERFAAAVNGAVDRFDDVMINRTPNWFGLRYAGHLEGGEHTIPVGRSVRVEALPEGLNFDDDEDSVSQGEFVYSRGKNGVIYKQQMKDIEYTARPKTTRAVTLAAGAALLTGAYKTIKAIGGKLFSSKKEEVVDTDEDEEETDTAALEAQEAKAKADADAQAAAQAKKRAQEELARKEAQVRAQAAKAIEGAFARCNPSQQTQVKRQLSIIERHAKRNGLKVAHTLDTIAFAMYGNGHKNARQQRARA